jgi:Xaa-Pro aminopeptidase
MKIKSISNFSGSNAVALITNQEAFLWTDSRYYIQAEKELNKNDWKIIPFENSQNDLKNNIKKIVKEGTKIAVDMKTISVSSFKILRDNLDNYTLINDDKHILNEITAGYEKPNPIYQNVIINDLKYAGKTPRDKIRQVSETFYNEIKMKYKIKGENFSIVINKLDEIACMIYYIYRAV